MTTPREVAAELVARGYGSDQKKVERLLTDWRTKHVMPALTMHGRGQGPGRLNYWTQNDIIERALLAHSLFDANQPADAVLMGIWILGFEVPMDALRDSWLRLVDEKLERKIQAKLERDQTLADVLTDAVQPAIRNVRRILDVKRSTIEFAALEVGDIIFDPKCLFDEGTTQTLRETIKHLVAEKKLFGDGVVSENSFDLKSGIVFLRATQSPRAMKSLISAALDDELICARDFWLRTWARISQMVPHSPALMPGLKLTWSQHWSIVLGRHAIPAILHARRIGHAARLERTFWLVESAAGECDLFDALAQFLGSGKMDPYFLEFIFEFLNIWNFSARGKFADRQIPSD